MRYPRRPLRPRFARGVGTRSREWHFSPRGRSRAAVRCALRPAWLTSFVRPLLVRRRVGGAGFLKALKAQAAAIAPATRPAGGIGVVTTQCQAVIDAKADSGANDLCLCLIDER